MHCVHCLFKINTWTHSSNEIYSFSGIHSSVCLNFYFPQIVLGQSDTPCQAPIIAVNSDTCVFLSSTTAGAAYQSDSANGEFLPVLFPVHLMFGMQWLFRHPEPLHSRQKPVLSPMAEWQYIQAPAQPQLLECDDDAAAGMMAVVDRSDFIPATLFHSILESSRKWYRYFFSLRNWVPFRLSGLQQIYWNNTGEWQCIFPGSNQDAFAYYCDISEFQSHWFRFRFLTAGTFILNSFPILLAIGMYPDYDWLLYRSSGTGFCDTFTSQTSPDVCNGSSSMGPNGENRVGCKRYFEFCTCRVREIHFAQY